MDVIKKAVRIFSIAAMAMLVSAASVLATTSSDIEKPKRVYNGSFEDPKFSGSYTQIAAKTVPYWRTTAINESTQIELFIKNKDVYFKPGILIPRDGKQAAEVNSQEESTMYQYLYGAPGSVYEWGVSHRARSNVNNAGKRDIMAVFIGPRQPYDPKKDGTNASTNKDQFKKTVDWLKDNHHLDTSGLQDGDCKAFEVFTTKFNADGGFEAPVNYTEPISLTQTTDHTEKWHVWIVTSSTDSWYDYGVNAAEDCAAYGGGQGEYVTRKDTNPSYPDDEIQIKYKQPDYNYQYTVPASSGSDEAVTMYAFCAYETASTDANKKLTIGNFIDDVKLSLKVPVRVTSTEGGSTAVEIPGSTGTVTNTQQFSDTTAAGNMINLTITPGSYKEDEEEKQYTFLGAFVNNKWKSAKDTTLFTENEVDGTYTYKQAAEDGENYIHIVFAKHPYIIHSPNGGIYNGTTVDTADKIDKEGTYSFSEAPTAGNQARFAHWIIAGVENEDGTPATVGATHTVEAAQNREDSSKYDITVKDASGKTVATIKKTDVVVLIARYEYPQTVNVYTMIGGKWVLSEDGGTASIDVSSARESNGASKTIYVEDNTIISVSASPNDEYRLVRMVSGDSVTTEKTYMYNAVGPRTTSVYFMEGDRKPIVSYVDEFNTENTDTPSYVWDTNLGKLDEKKKVVSDVGGIYGSTVSTAFSGLWAGDEQTYTYIQWVIELPFDTETLVKENDIHGSFTGINIDRNNPYKTDSEAVNAKFNGKIYRCAAGNAAKQLAVNFPTEISGAATIYSTIILDGIYSPNSTALLHAVTEINAEDGNLLENGNGFSMNASEDYRTYRNNYYITELN